MLPMGLTSAQRSELGCDRRLGFHIAVIDAPLQILGFSAGARTDQSLELQGPQDFHRFFRQQAARNSSNPSSLLIDATPLQVPARRIFDNHRLKESRFDVVIRNHSTRTRKQSSIPRL